MTIAEQGRIASRPSGGADTAAAWWRHAGVAAVAAGFALRVWQYLARASLSVDEAAIARNVLDRGVWELVSTPLAFAQVAPRGWLAIVKLCSVVLGSGELSLRLMPLVGGVATVVAAHLLARRLLTEAGAAIVTLLVALATPLILFSANLKPYSTDVCLALVTILLADRAITGTMRWVTALRLAAFGVLAVLLSSAVVFAMGPAAAMLAVSSWQRPQDRRRRLFVAASWLLACVVAGVMGLRAMRPPDAAYMQLFWSSGFGPTTIGDTPRWCVSALNVLFGSRGNAFEGNLEYAITGPLVAAVGLGAARLLWTSIPRAVLVAGPIVAALAAGSLHLYPFQGRLVMFLIPLLLLLSVAGMEMLGSIVLRGPWLPILPLLLIVPAAQATLRQPMPQQIEHLRPVLEHMVEQSQPGDATWVYYGAGQAFRYYQHRLAIGGDVSVCDRSNPRSQLQQVDRLRGRSRVWVVLTHTAANGAADERKLLTDYLDRIGTRRSELSVASPGERPDEAASAFLYDLSDERRLASATADRFPVPDRAGTEWSCYGTMTPDGKDGDRAATAVLDAAKALRR